MQGIEHSDDFEICRFIKIALWATHPMTKVCAPYMVRSGSQFKHIHVLPNRGRVPAMMWCNKCPFEWFWAIQFAKQWFFLLSLEKSCPTYMQSGQNNQTFCIWRKGHHMLYWQYNILSLQAACKWSKGKSKCLWVLVDIHEASHRVY